MVAKLFVGQHPVTAGNRLGGFHAVNGRGFNLAPPLGSHREMVTREFGHLAESGILRQNGRRLVLLNLERLMKEIHYIG